MTKYIRRRLKPTTASGIARSGIAAVAVLCLSFGLAYTVLLPPDTVLPDALKTLLDLPLLRRIGPAGRILPGCLWLAAAALGALSLRWRRVEKAWWFAALGVFGFWGGMYIGGSLTGSPRGWVFGVLFLLVGVVLAVLWWALDALRVQAAHLADLAALAANQGP